MATFMLVHGAWHGSWCWKRVRAMLIKAGHSVFVPTLTGIGERSHLLSRSVCLETHVSDIVNLLLWEDLRDVVLVGHSYGASVVRHAADRQRDRIRSVVYLDGFVPEDGQSLSDCSQDGGEGFRQMARETGDGWKLLPVPATMLGVNERDCAWVDAKCTPHPLATFEDKARLTGACDCIENIGYIRATGFPQNPFVDTARMAGERGWRVSEIASGHDAMIDQPEALASILVRDF